MYELMISMGSSFILLFNCFNLQELAEKCCPGEAGVICEMLNLHLFTDPIFVIFTVSNFCTSVGFNVPFVYLAAQAEELGISKEKASYLLSIIGIANTVGRIVLGFLADKSWVNRLYVYNVCLTACGIGKNYTKAFN